MNANDKPKRTLTSHTALRTVKNEKLLCVACLKSSEGPDDRVVYCHLSNEPQIRAKEHYCAQGIWLINGAVVDFKEGFQMVYDKDRSVAESKEILV